VSLRAATPCALTIAGSDSGGGAGVQADLKTFASLEVHGTSVVTCLTAQHPDAVLHVEPASPDSVLHQLRAVYDGFRPAAVKTGMLYSQSLIELVAGFLGGRSPLSLVVDPVMIATSGARLLRRRALAALCSDLLPMARMVTPNLEETQVLTGLEIHEPEDMRKAARMLRDRYGCAALIKGGHLHGPESVDLYWDGREELLLSAPRVGTSSVHGTGCTYSAAITGYIARGCPLAEAVAKAKLYVTRAIAEARRVHTHLVLAHPNRNVRGATRRRRAGTTAL
jgi:hydroxymethylpyrimidine/phosphomethylpyrimidine kinase